MRTFKCVTAALTTTIPGEGLTMVMVMSGRCGAAETPDEHLQQVVWHCHAVTSIVVVYVLNDVMLQDHMHKNDPTTKTNPCPYNDTATTKTVDLLHADCSITFPSTSIDVCASTSTRFT